MAMSKNAKVGIGVVAAVLAACLCLCVCGALGFVVFGGALAEQMVVQDSAEAHRMGTSMLDYQLPEGYRELAAMNILTVKMVMIGPAETLDVVQGELDPMIVIAQVASRELMEDPQVREQVERSIEQSFRNSFQQQSVDWELVDSSPVTIRGQEVNVNTYEGESATGQPVRQLVTDLFDGQGGATFIMMVGTVEAWPKDAIDAFLGSIE